MRFTAAKLRQRIEEGLPPNSVTGKAEGPDTSTSNVVDLSELLTIRDDEEFLREAYRRVLRRESDLPGFLHYRELLRNHVPRRTILRCLISSEEARRSGVKYTGFQTPFWKGDTLRSRARLWITSTLERLLNLARWLHRVVLLHPVELLERKLDYLYHELGVRTEQLSTKVDAYVGQLRADLEGAAQREATLLQALGNALEHQGERLETSTARLEAIRESLITHVANLDWQMQRLDERLRSLEAALGQLRAGVEQAAQRQVTVWQAVQEVLELQGERLENGKAEVRRVLEVLGERAGAVERRLGTYEERLTQLAQAVACSERDLKFLYSEFLAAVSDLPERVAAGMHPPVIRAGDNVFVTERSGFIFGVPAREWRFLAYLVFRGLPEPGLVRLFRSLIKPGMVVVDVGAHIGIYTLEAARLLAGRGRVYSFEPTPETFAILRDNVQVNGFLESGVIVLHQVAVSDRDGLATLGVYADNSGHNTLFPDDHCTSRLAVKTVSLDQALASETHVDVVKIDAEGAEPLILRGMKGILRANPGIRILMEFAPVHLRRAGLDPAGWVEEIQSMGFDIARVDDGTGEALPVSKDELIQAYSLNLLLVQRCQSLGEASS